MSSLYDPGQELSTLDFGNLIGGPLSAVVDAQIRAAESTVNYIKNVGFDENGDPNYVAFTYPKEISPYVAGEAHSIEAFISDNGSDYTVIPYVEIIGDGYGARAEAQIENGVIKQVIITNQGYNYTNVSSVKVLPPKYDLSNEFMDSDLEISLFPNGGIKEVIVVNGKAGKGYTHPPIIELSGDGAGAKLETEINEDGEVIKVNIIESGSGYKKDGTDLTKFGDTIDIIHPAGTGAEITVNFTSGKPSQAAQFMDMKLEVPLLTMVPIPYIRVEETTIDFNAKINSVERISTEQSIGFNANFSTETNSNYNSKTGSGKKKVGKKGSVKYKNFSETSYSKSRKTKFNVSASYKRTNNRNTSIEKTYTMGIQVKATQEEIPAGMEKVLGILENTIVSQPI